MPDGPPDKFQFLPLDNNDEVALAQLEKARKAGWTIDGFLTRHGVWTAVLEGNYQ